MRVIVGLVTHLVIVRAKIGNEKLEIFKGVFRGYIFISIICVRIYASLGSFTGASNIINGLTIVLSLYGLYLVGKVKFGKIIKSVFGMEF